MTIEDVVNNAKNEMRNTLSRWVYFVVIAFVIAIAVLLELGGFERVEDINWWDLIIDALPMFLMTVILDRLFYNNGKEKGKTTQRYIRANMDFSTHAGNLSGEDLESLPDFCSEYNNKAIANIQKTYLTRACVSFDMFSMEWEKDEIKYAPLKIMPRKTLKSLFNKDQIHWILKARRVSVVGLNATTLTSGQKQNDPTFVGKTEKEYTIEHSTKKVISYALTFILFSMVVAKDLSEWGWAGVGFLLFRIFFTLGTSLFAHISGYTDITSGMVTYYNRKVDILKQFENWKKVNKIDKTV